MKTSILPLYLVILCFFCFIGSNTFAKNYYVDPSYSGTQTGALATPYTSIAQVGNSVVAGDTVFIKKGTSSPGNWYLSKSGTAGHPIVYTGYGSGTLPTLIYSSGNDIAIHFAGVSYVVIDGIKITDPTLASDVNHTALANIMTALYLQSSTYCTIKNCDISLVGSGVSTDGSSNYTTISNNLFYNLRMQLNTPTSVNNNDDHGAAGVGIQSSNNTVTYNTFTDNWATSYDYVWDGGAIEFYGVCNNNTIMYNTTNLCNGFTEVAGGSGSTFNNNIIAYNKIINCGSLAWLHPGITSINNLQVYNNVIVQTSTAPYAIATQLLGSDGGGPAGMVVLKNNIIWNNSSENFLDNSFATSAIVHSNNMYHLSGGALHLTLGSTESSVTTNPWTTSTGDASTWNYVLPSGSAAINYGTGVSLTQDFAGTAISGNPDAGILEAGSPVIVTTLTAVATATSAISCNGGTASVTVTATGGTAPYTGNGTFTVKAGTYNYTVTDAKGLSATAAVTVTEPTAVASTVTSGTISVNGGTTSIFVAASGGTSPYTYNLNAAAFQAASTFTNVLAGTYTVITKDVNGCASSQNIAITQPASVTPLAAVATVTTAISCNGGTASLTVAATGGTAPYTGTGTFTVKAGTYTYTVTDAKGLSTTAPVTVTEPTAVVSTVTSGTISVNGGTTSIFVAASGGTSPYTYNLNAAAFQSASTFTNVLAGTYAVIAKDANGCVANQSITLTEPGIVKVPVSGNFTISVYPNPSRSYFSVNISNYPANSYISVIVYNVWGSQVYRSYGKNQFTFGSRFASGNYVLSVTIGQVTQTVKLVKM